MSAVWARLTGLALACGATIVWLINLTAWQKLTEPAKPWGDAAAEDNTYWARDLRWALIAAALVGLVIAVRGERWRSTVIGLAGVGWVVLDAVLDRHDVGPRFAWIAGAAVVAAALVALVVAALVSDPRRPVGRGALLLAAYVAAALVEVAADMSSPTDGEFALNLGAALTAGFLVVGAAAAALAAGPALNRRRLLAAGAVIVVAAGLIGAAREAGPYHRGWLIWALATLAILGVFCLSELRFGAHPRRRLLGVTGVAALGYPVLAGGLFLVSISPMNVAALFTALAGNPPVNSSDTDAIMSFPAILTGLVMGGARLFWPRLRPRKLLAQMLRIEPPSTEIVSPVR